MARTKRAPGKHYRKGLTVLQLMELFPDDQAAERWFERVRWAGGRSCPDCGSVCTVTVKNRRPMPYRCRDCRSHFSVRKGTVMQSSKIGLRKWAIAIYMMTTSLKGVSSMKLYRELGITQKTAWFLMQRIREGFLGEGYLMDGPVEVDETYFGGKAKNMSKARRKQLTGRGAVDKTAVVGAKDRATNSVTARVVTKTDANTLQGFVKGNVMPGAAVYTDEAAAYQGLPNHHSVSHSTCEYVRGMAHTNGVESFWSMMKRGYVGTYHKLSPKHLDRYIKEFAGRHNIRGMGTLTQMAVIAYGLDCKRLSYRTLIADNGLDSGAR